MITLLTGKPGTGKTAYAVAMLMDDPLLKERPIYTNITDLKLPHYPIDADWIRNWHKNAPQEAFILYDECQDVFVPRHASKEPPEFVNELTKHRKDYSVDFFLITQRASFIDHMVRGLCQRHIHIRETGLTRMVHEAPEVSDFDDKSVRETAASRPYKLPKHAFGQYTSAQVHTKKQRRRLPTSVYFFGIAITTALGLAYYVYTERLSPNLKSDEAVKVQEAGLPASAPSAAVQAPVSVPASIVEATTPTDVHNPLSAPLYAAVAPPPTPPEVQGCIANARKCTCYSQQQTPVWMPEEQCRARAAGEYYDPYRPLPLPESKTQAAYAYQQDSKATAPAGGLSRPAKPVESFPSSPPPAGEAQT